MVQVGLAPHAIERVRADVAVLPLFAGERPLRDAAGRVDWRLCGRLSHLLAAGRLRGEPGEAVLIPGGGGMRSPRVLALGLGERRELDAGRWAEWVDAALARAGRLRARSAVIALPESAGALTDRLAALLESAARAGVGEVALAPEPTDAPAVADWLRRMARSGRPEGVEIRAPATGHGPSTGREPRGGGRPESSGESSRTSAGRFTR